MILLTGASQGIGLAVAEALLTRTDRTLLLTGRSAERLARACESLGHVGQRRVQTLVSDHARLGDVTALADAVRDGTYPLTGAILGVGVNPMYEEGPHRLHRVPPTTIAMTIATNCTHTAILSSALLARFVDTGGGTLIWIGSHASRSGLTGAAVYCGSKSFLSGLATAVSREYAGRQVRAAVVHPGPVRTPRTMAVIDRFAGKHGLEVGDATETGDRIADLYCADGPLTPEVYL